MSPLSRLRCRLISRTTITLATVGIATAVAPVGLAVATPMAAGPAVAAVTQVLTVGAYADAHIQQATPSTNFGASTTLQADSGSGVTKRIYLKFVVSGVPADASLSVARLRMTATNSSGAVVSAKPGSHNNWSESGVKWSNAPVYGLRTDNSPAVTAGPVEWDLSSYVSGNGVYSVILTQASSTQTSFRSSESAQPPELELTYTTGVPSSDPVIVAAGDIACSTSDPSYNNGAGTATACRQRATSDLVLAQPSAAVLALGDLQYSLATLDQFTRSYDPAWGRVKSLTRPIPGNHEYAVPMPAATTATSAPSPGTRPWAITATTSAPGISSRSTPTVPPAPAGGRAGAPRGRRRSSGCGGIWQRTPIDARWPTGTTRVTPAAMAATAPSWRISGRPCTTPGPMSC